DLDEYQLHSCVEIASAVGPEVLPGACERLIASLSARLYNGAVACHCHPQGSENTVCDQVTGRCPCRGEVAGCYCDRCLEGYFGFPNCRPFLCNGFSVMLQLWRFYNWEKLCVDGYHGNPSSGQSCRPCPCPDVPSSNQYFAHSCYQNPWSSDVICNCLQGYAVWRMLCWFLWKCKNFGSAPPTLCLQQHIDVTDPESCSPVTGEGLKRLHNTQGPSCQLCRPGVVDDKVIMDLPPNDGSVLPGCSCHPSGAGPVTIVLMDAGMSSPAEDVSHAIVTPGPHSIDTFTGQCPCRLGYDGKRYSECEENYYGDPLGRCIPCDCNRKDSQKHICDQDTGTCHCREGVSGPRCDRCAQGHGQEFPACLRCHLCFDQWDHTISSLSKAVQGLIRLAGNMEDKRETLPSRIIMTLFVSRGKLYEFQDLKETRGRTRNKVNLLLEDLQEEINSHSRARKASIMGKRENAPQLSVSGQELIKSLIPQRTSRSIIRALSAEKKTNETTSFIDNSEKNRNDLLTILDTLTSKENLSLEKLKQIKIPDIQILHEKVCGGGTYALCAIVLWWPELSRLLTLSRNTLQKAQEAEFVIRNLNNQVQGLKNQIKNISKLAEGSKNNALQLSEKLRNMKNQSESEEEKMNLLIKKLKMFLLEDNVPPEDIERVANRVPDIHLPVTSQNLTHEFDKIRKLMQLCEDYRTEENRLNKAADGAGKVLVKAKAAEKAANVLLNLDKMLNKLQQVHITQVRASSTITQLTAQITKIKKNALQAENQARETENELDFAKQQSALEGGLARLQTKLQRNRDEAIRVGAQAESARRQAGGLEEELAELQCQYAILQHKTSTPGLAKETLGKVKQPRDAAVKLAADTEDKVRRITDLETKIQALNLSRQEKADQLKQ
ncbi:hypothetical protein E2I00_006734, partial [Balaenoptera physalus]